MDDRRNFSLRSLPTGKDSITPKHRKYFRHHKPSFESIGKENIRVLDCLVSCRALTRLCNFWNGQHLWKWSATLPLPTKHCAQGRAQTSFPTPPVSSLLNTLDFVETRGISPLLQVLFSAQLCQIHSLNQYLLPSYCGLSNILGPLGHGLK